MQQKLRFFLKKSMQQKLRFFLKKNRLNMVLSQREPVLAGYNILEQPNQSIVASSLHASLGGIEITAPAARIL
jgi:hypothetical protein